MEELSGRCAVVTGAASGIGRALAGRFAAEGMKVVLADVEKGPLEEAAAALSAQTEALAVPTDVSDGTQVDALAGAAEDAFGPVHVLCNNAGVATGGLIHDLTTEDWEWVLGVNLWGVIHGLRAFLPGMLTHGEPGHVVNTASMAGLVTGPMMAPYGASKFAVVAISEALYHEQRMTGSRIGVSVLCPGWVRTRIDESARNRPGSLAESRPPADDARAELMRQLLASGMSPDDVAARVHEAIVEDRFWVLTHPDMLGGVEARMRSVLDGINPELRLGLAAAPPPPPPDRSQPAV